MNLTVNGVAHEVERLPARTAPRRLARRTRRHRAEGGLSPGRLRRRAPCSSTASRAARASSPVGYAEGTAGHDRRRARAAGETSRRSSRRSSTTTPRSAASARSGMLLAAQAYIDAWRHGRPRGDPARARRSRLSLHRLLEDHRRRGSRCARRLLRPDDDRRQEAHDDVEWRWRHEGRRRTDPALRRRRPRHRPDDVRRRRARPGNALGEGVSAPAPQRGHHEAWTRRKAESMPGVHAVITWKDVPLLEYGHLSALGHPGGRAAAREGRGALPRTSRSRSSRAEQALEPLPRSMRSRSASKKRPALLDVRQAFDADAPKIHHWGNWYPHFEDEMDRSPDPQGRHRLGLRERGHDRPGRLSARRDRARADRDDRSARSSPSRTAG